MNHFYAQTDIMRASTSGHWQLGTRAESLGTCRELGRMSLLHILCVQTQRRCECGANPGCRQWSLNLRYFVVDLLNVRGGSNLREHVVKHLHFPDKMTSLWLLRSRAEGGNLYSCAGCLGSNADSNSWLTCAGGLVPNDSVFSFFPCEVKIVVTWTSEGFGSELIHLKCLVLGERWTQGRTDSLYSLSVEPSVEHLVAA